jgi:hypothetical protein
MVETGEPQPVRIARPIAAVPRLALKSNEAAAALGVSRDFFDEHMAAELNCVRRGRLKLYPVSELNRWLEREAARVLDDLAAR